MRIAFVPLGFAAGALLARVLFRYAPPDFSVDRAQPLVVVTYWQQFGAFNDGKGEPGQINAVSHGCSPARFRQVNVLLTD